MQQSHTFASPTSQHTSQSLQKSVPAQPYRHSITDDKQTMTERRPACNTGLAKVAVQCSADTFVVNQTLVLRINPPRRMMNPDSYPSAAKGLPTALRDCNSYNLRKILNILDQDILKKFFQELAFFSCN